MKQDNIQIPEGYINSSQGIIPQGWEVKRLGEVCSTFKSGNSITSKNIFEKEIYPVYGGNGLRGYTNTYTHDGEYILIGRQGALCGNITYCIGKQYISEHAIAVQADKNNSLKFFSYKLDFWNLNRFSESSAQPGLSVEKLIRYKLALPPLAEQQKIAEILSTWDEAIEKQSTLIDKLTERKRGLMQQLLTGKKRLTGFNEEWKEVRLGEICEIKKGAQVNKIDLDITGQYPTINGGIEPSGFSNNYNTLENTITISEGGNSCGYVNLITTRFWCGGHCYAIKRKSIIANYFLYQLLKFNEKEIMIMSLRVGSGLPNIQIKPLYNLLLNFPSLPEQTAIANILNAADKEIELAKSKLELLHSQKSGLMQQLLTGKTRVKI